MVIHNKIELLTVSLLNKRVQPNLYFLKLEPLFVYFRSHETTKPINGI